MGRYIPALSGWSLCIDECTGTCVICVHLPSWAGALDVGEVILSALYIASRETMDYRLASAMHVFRARFRVSIDPELLASLYRESRVVSKLHGGKPGRGGCGCGHEWEAVLYRGAVYASAILDLDRSVPVAVDPPRDRRVRERLRRLLDGGNGAGGIVRDLDGERIAPWVYMVPKGSLHKLKSELEARLRRVDPDLSVEIEIASRHRYAKLRIVSNK